LQKPGVNAEWAPEMILKDAFDASAVVARPSNERHRTPMANDISTE